MKDTTTPALLEATDISKAYGGVQALSGCSLQVQQGTIASLIGPNGSGKTTLFNIITGYERADAGSVRLDGREIGHATPDKVCHLGIGRTFQLTRIFPRLTVLENMLVAQRQQHGLLGSMFTRTHTARQERDALEWLGFVGITRLAGEPAGNLSYGQRKLLELAYVLLSDPAVILLDEPAGGVNPTLIKLIGDRIRELNAQGRTFLIVEHNMEFVMSMSHQVTVMHAGRAIVTGPPDSVRSDRRVVDAYLGEEVA